MKSFSEMLSVSTCPISMLKFCARRKKMTKIGAGKGGTILFKTQLCAAFSMTRLGHFSQQWDNLVHLIHDDPC
jgi:hypothetical protein